MIVFDFVNSITNKINSRLFFLNLFVFQVIFVFLGIDFTDQGWSAVFYQQIFNEPKSVEYCFGRWFTGIVGGVWLLVFGKFGIIGIRVLGILFFTATLLVTYNLLKNYFDKKKIKTGLLFITLLIGPYWTFAGFHYDTLSAFFIITIVFFLFKGLTEKSNGNIFLAGFFLGLNIFARIPNITGVMLLSLIVYYGYQQKETYREMLKNLMLFLAGTFLASLLLIILMVSLKHDSIFYNAFLDIQSSGSDSSDRHGIFNMLKMYGVQYAEVVARGLLSICGMVLIIAAAKVLKKNLFFLVPFIASLLIYLSFVENDFMRIKEMFSIYGVILFFCLHALFARQLIFEQRFLILSGLAVFVLLPVGSDLGFINMNGLNLFIVLPIAFERLQNIKSINIFRIVIADDRIISIARNSIIMVALPLILFGTWYYTYCEKNGKNYLTHPINNELAACVYTSKERARVINELLLASKSYVKKDDYVLAYDWMPMFHYLTETKPYLYNMGLPAYSAKKFKKALEKSISEKNFSPVIIVQKTEMWGNWPPETGNEYHLKDSEKNQYLKDFLVNYKYIKVWENDSFQLFIPE